MTTLAGTIITRVRALVPDPVFSGDTPQPDADGLFRASDLYGWLDDGVKIMASRGNWTLFDWTAMSMVAAQPVYPVSALWGVLDQAYSKALRLKIEAQSAAVDIYPNREASAQSNRAYVFRVTDHIDLGFDPPPSTADPVTTLNGALTAPAITIALASSAGFLPFGFATIEDELVQYQSIGGNSLNGVTRGAGGTTAAAHAGGAAVHHCSLWVKGYRVPVPVVSSTSVIEVPLPWVSMLNWYLLAQCLESQQETQRAETYMKRWDAFCQGIAQQTGGRDPITRQPVVPEPPAAAPMPVPAAAQQGG